MYVCYEIFDIGGAVVADKLGEYIYKTKRGYRTRPSIHASDQLDINLRAGPVGPLKGGYPADRERGY